jgi:hypothetical protein
MLRSVPLLVSLLFAAAMFPGCASDQSTGGAAAMGARAEICTGCGQIKGSEMCCVPGQRTCAGCGLAKGSPGCCRVEKGSSRTYAICGDCGQLAGSAQCCAPGATHCAACGLVAGSPGCCRLKK